MMEPDKNQPTNHVHKIQLSHMANVTTWDMYIFDCTIKILATREVNLFFLLVPLVGNRLGSSPHDKLNICYLPCPICKQRLKLSLFPCLCIENHHRDMQPCCQNKVNLAFLWALILMMEPSWNTEQSNPAFFLTAGNI